MTRGMLASLVDFESRLLGEVNTTELVRYITELQAKVGESKSQAEAAVAALEKYRINATDSEAMPPKEDVQITILIAEIFSDMIVHGMNAKVVADSAKELRELGTSGHRASVDDLLRLKQKTEVALKTDPAATTPTAATAAATAAASTAAATAAATATAAAATATATTASTAPVTATDAADATGAPATSLSSGVTGTPTRAACNGTPDPDACHQKDYAGKCNDDLIGKSLRDRCPLLCGTCISTTSTTATTTTTKEKCNGRPDPPLCDFEEDSPSLGCQAEIVGEVLREACPVRCKTCVTSTSTTTTTATTATTTTTTTTITATTTSSSTSGAPACNGEPQPVACNAYVFETCSDALIGEAVSEKCPVLCQSCVTTTATTTTTVTTTTSTTTTTTTTQTTSSTSTSEAPSCNGVQQPESCKEYSHGDCSDAIIGSGLVTKCPVMCKACVPTTSTVTTTTSTTTTTTTLTTSSTSSSQAPTCNGVPQATSCGAYTYDDCSDPLYGAAVSKECPVLCRTCVTTTVTTTTTGTTTTTFTTVTTSSTSTSEAPSCNGVQQPESCKDYSHGDCSDAIIGSGLVAKCPVMCKACVPTTTTTTATTSTTTAATTLTTSSTSSSQAPTCNGVPQLKSCDTHSYDDCSSPLYGAVIRETCPVLCRTCVTTTVATTATTQTSTTRRTTASNFATCPGTNRADSASCGVVFPSELCEQANYAAVMSAECPVLCKSCPTTLATQTRTVAPVSNTNGVSSSAATTQAAATTSSAGGGGGSTEEATRATTPEAASTTAGNNVTTAYQYAPGACDDGVNFDLDGCGSSLFSRCVLPIIAQLCPKMCDACPATTTTTTVTTTTTTSTTTQTETTTTTQTTTTTTTATETTTTTTTTNYVASTCTIGGVRETDYPGVCGTIIPRAVCQDALSEKQSLAQMYCPCMCLEHDTTSSTTTTTATNAQGPRQLRRPQSTSHSSAKEHPGTGAGRLFPRGSCGRWACQTSLPCQVPFM